MGYGRNFLVKNRDLSTRDLFLEGIQRLLIRLTQLNPRVGLALAEYCGRCGGALLPRIYNHPPEDRSKWARLTGIQDRRALRDLRVRRSGRRRRRKVLESLLIEGKHACLRPLIRWESAEHLTALLDADRPVIAATWHAGPYAALGWGLLEFQRPVTLLLGRRTPSAPVVNLEELEVRKPADGVLVVKKCLSRLKEGRIIAMAGDQPAKPGGGVRVQLLDSRIDLKRGMPALARRAGAAVVPVHITWSPRGDLVFAAHPPLPTTLEPCNDPEVFEANALREFAEVVDRHLRDQPEEIEEGFWKELVRKHNIPRPQSGSLESSLDDHRPLARNEPLPADRNPM